MSAWTIRARLTLGAMAMDVELRGGPGLTALIGPNGSGKTTVLRLIAGAILPERGVIRVGAQCWFDSDRAIARPMESRRVGYVPQGYGLFEHLNVLDNVSFGLSVGAQKTSRSERKGKALAALRSVGCEGLARRWTGDLSGGERQRVALARAMVVEPSIMVLDEPLSALDIASRRRVRGALADHLSRLACPTLLVTHDVRDIEALEVETVAVLSDGKLVQTGGPAELRQRPINDFVAEFMGMGGAPR